MQCPRQERTLLGLGPGSGPLTERPCESLAVVNYVYAFVKGDRGEKVKYIVCYLVVSATEENNADKRDNACSHVYISKSLMCILIRNLKVVRKWIWGNNKSLGQITAPWD